MFEDYVPKKKIGVLSPLAAVESGPYEFYQIAPKGVILVTIPVGLREFSKEDVERVFASLDQNLDYLMGRSIDIIIQSGVPLPLLVGPEYLDRLLAHIRERTKLPTTSQVLCVVEAVKHMGIKKIVAANKWNEGMNENLGRFFAQGGISLLGTHSRSMLPSEFVKMSGLDGINLAYDLGRGAFQNFPETDAVYIGGSAWLTLPVIERLEEEFGKPVFTNHSATVWDLLHKLDFWTPIRGYGKLLNSD